MTLKIKIEGIKEYSLGGVKKIVLDKKYHREFYPFAYCNHCGQAIDWGDKR